MGSFLGDGVGASSMVALGLTVAFGLAVGQVRVGGVSLGVSGVLFSGLLLGHFGLTLNPEVSVFVGDFGLIVFIFAVGLQVGPGFVDSLRRKGLLLNALAAGGVLTAVALGVGLVWLSGLPASAVVGAFSGATTSTPALAAASQTVQELGVPELAQHLANLSLACALAYPFGILGVILAMLLTRWVGKIDIQEELRQLEEQARQQHPTMAYRNLQVTNANLYGRPLSSIPGLEDMGVTISRVMENGEVMAATPDTTVKEGMLVHVVGEPRQLDRAELIIGPEAETRLEEHRGQLEVRYLLVTESNALGKTLQTLQLTPDHGITVTRIRRAGMELAPRRFRTLHFGDKVVCVGPAAALDHAEHVLGNSNKAFDQPHLLPLFVGITLGVLVGSIPFAFPGLSSGFKLGLAGGPLLVAIVLSRVQRAAGMTWYLPSSASILMREMGICLFLACIGLNAGSSFLEAALSGTGLSWIGIGACITLLPLLVMAWAGRRLFRLNYATLCGLLVGTMTSAPTLAFAVDMLDSDEPSSVYATVYPLATILRILAAQGLILLFYASA